jgi:hypothetical protein
MSPCLHYQLRRQVQTAFPTELQSVRFQVLTAANMKMSSGMLRRVVWKKITDVSEVLVASIIRTMMAKASTSETRLHGATSHKTVIFKITIIYRL